VTPRIGRPVKAFERRIRAYWEEDRGLSVFLAFLVLVVFVLAPLSNPFPGRRSVFIVFISILFGFGAWAVTSSRRSGALVLALAAAPVLLHAAGRFAAGGPWDAASALAACGFSVTLAVLVGARVMRDGPITVHHIVGAVAIYLLIGIAFGEATRAMGLIDPEAYASASGRGFERADLYYFSFVTLTTVGYGDITPVHPFARSLAILEALTGQLFPAILIARLVSQELASRPSRR
jgi:voltage-gated potassium channel Kch